MAILSIYVVLNHHLNGVRNANGLLSAVVASSQAIMK